MTSVKRRLPKYCERLPSGSIRYKPKGGPSITFSVPPIASYEEIKAELEKKIGPVTDRQPLFCYKQDNGKIRFKPKVGKSVILDLPPNPSYEEVVAARDAIEITNIPTSLAYAFQSYQKTYRWKKLSPRTQSCYEIYIASIEKVFGKADMSQVKTEEFTRWRDARAYGRNGEGGSPTQAGKELGFLKQVVRHAVEYGLWGSEYYNKIEAVQPPVIPKESRIVPNTKLAPIEWFFKIMEAGPPEIKAVGLLSYVTGLRLGDVLSLEKDDIGEDYSLSKMQNKTGTHIVKTPTRTLAKVIESAFDLPGHQKNIFTPYLLPNAQGRKYTEDGFKSVWQRAKIRAFPEGTPEGFRMRFHDLRHRGTTDFAGQNKADFTGHTGNARDKMAEHYDENSRLPIDSPSLEIDLPETLFH